MPERYLQNFTPQLMEQIKAEEFLNSLPKANVYAVPVNYFTTWEANIPLEKKQTVFSYRNFGIAASLLLLLSIGIQFVNVQTKQLSNSQITSALQQVPKEEIVQYVTNNIEEFDLESFITDSAVASTKLVPTITIEDAKEFLATENLEEYL
jgi:hypothetical protein